jgi:hypothetical protein
MGRLTPAGGPPGHADDVEHQDSAEGLILVLRVALGQLRPEGALSVGVVALPAQLGSYPPQLRPIVAVPLLAKQCGPRVVLQIPLPLEVCRGLRLDRVDGYPHVAVLVDRVRNRHSVDASLGVQSAQDSVVVCSEASQRVVWVELQFGG